MPLNRKSCNVRNLAMDVELTQLASRFLTLLLNLQDSERGGPDPDPDSDSDASHSMIPSLHVDSL